MYIEIYKIGNEIGSFSASDFSPVNPESYLVAEVEGKLSDLTDEQASNLASEFSLVDGMLQSSKHKIISIAINENYVEPTLEADTSQTQSQLENM
jgi:hypothetical protein